MKDGSLRAIVLSLLASNSGIAQEEPRELDHGKRIGAITFSRDGGHLAYTIDGELRTISIDGKTEREFLKVDEVFGWNPDGDQILCKIGDSDLATVSVKDSRVARWTPSQRWRFIDWDDGGKLLIRSAP